MRQLLTVQPLPLIFRNVTSKLLPPTVVRPFFARPGVVEGACRTLILPCLQAPPKLQQLPLRSCERLAVGFVPDGSGMTEQRLAGLEGN